MAQTTKPDPVLRPARQLAEGKSVTVVDANGSTVTLSPKAPNRSVPDFREAPHGRGDANATAIAAAIYNDLKIMTLQDGSPTEISKRIVVIENSPHTTAIYGYNVDLKNAYAEPILRSGEPTGGYVRINPTEVFSYSYRRGSVVIDENVYSQPHGRMAHELTHISDFVQFGFAQTLQREHEASRVENQILNLMGFPVRTHYGKHPIPDHDKYIPKPSGSAGSTSPGN